MEFSEKVAITIWVNPKDAMYLMEVLKILDNLPMQHIEGYTWQPDDVSYSEAMISNWMQISLTLDLWMKLRASVNVNKKR